MDQANNERRSAGIAVAAALGWNVSVRIVSAVASGITHIDRGLASAADVAAQEAKFAAQIATGAARLIAEIVVPGE